MKHPSPARPILYLCCSSLLAIGCATSQPLQNKTAAAPKMLAAMHPVAVPEDEPSTIETPETPGESAADHLQRAFALLNNGYNERAAQSFQAAIRTGALNEAGRAWAYWHIYVSTRDVGDIDASADALTSFVAVSEQLVNAEAGSEHDEFVERFDLPRRLSLARAMLSLIWSQRVPRFGRTEARPIPVQDEREIDYFLELASPCGSETMLRVSSSSLDEVGRQTRRITVSCNEEANPQDYFFAPRATERASAR